MQLRGDHQICYLMSSLLVCRRERDEATGEARKFRDDMLGVMQQRSKAEAERDEAEARIEELEYRNGLLERRRGGECQICGSWVCPPLTCFSCQNKFPDKVSQETVAASDKRANQAEAERDRLREAVESALGISHLLTSGVEAELRSALAKQDE